MSNDGPPKLYTTKPKKSQLKQQNRPMAPPPPPAPPSSTVTTSAASSSSSSGVPPPKESFARRYKFVWPVLLTVNFAIGVYLFLRTNKKDSKIEDGEVAATVPSTPVAITTSPVVEKPLSSPPVIEPVKKVLEPIPAEKQIELFKWVLEEKRKVKPANPEEKKKLDEEKDLLKQFIRGKIPPF